jgi:signal transduction histidine kinase
MRSGRLNHGLLLAATLLGLAAAITLLSLWLRTSLREQILRREAAALHSATVWQRALERDRIASLGLAPADAEFALIALDASRLPNAIGVEAFRTDGTAATEVGRRLGIDAPTPEEWMLLRQLQPFARYQTGWEDYVEITVPLHEPDSNQLTGAVRYRCSATALRQEFARLDRDLLRQALIVWAVSGSALALALGLVFRRLQRAEAALLTRTHDLQQANRELTFAAKTSALGAITAHLVHGLRNPVSGLSALASSPTEESAETLREASAAARRIREMVDEVVTLLREENLGAAYEVPAGEVTADVARTSAALAAKREVRLAVTGATARLLDNRTAALAGAILRNLTRNAIEAAPRGSGHVILDTTEEPGRVVFAVSDNGPGLPAAVSARLFEPTVSAKPEGAGIGLAISRQLASSLGATLDHHPLPVTGACFRLSLPIPLR